MLDNNAPGALVLELGAGSGWQARELNRKGYQVKAIDLADSDYADKRVWPVIDYDGENIPFSESSFDVVFSSNVLEHVENYPQINREILRVLNPDGLVIHVVPSATWRFWSIISHYISLLKISVMFFWSNVKRKTEKTGSEAVSVKRSGRDLIELIRKALFPARHGIAGNTLTEIYWFSARRWEKLFENSGWCIRTSFQNHLFYTGRLVMGNVFPLAFRKILSIILGSSCHVFVLNRKAFSESKKKSLYRSRK